MIRFCSAQLNRSLFPFLALLISVSAFLHGNAVAGTVTAATGGNAISADTTSAAGGSGAWTSLSGPSYQETVNGDLNTGTVVLTVPAGFEFNTGVTVSVVLVSGATNAVTNINGTAVGGTVATATVTTTTITFTITSKSRGNVLNQIRWQGIQVHPTSGSPLASGNITPSGTSGIAVVANSTNFGTLTEVAGATTLAFAQQPSDALVNAIISPAITVQVQDKFGNIISGSRSVTMTLSSGTGLLSGTTTQTTNAAGLATFGDLSINLTGTKNLTAASLGLTSVVSNTFIINNPVPTTASISPASKNAGDLAFVMTVNGTNFVPASVVRFAGSDRVTTYISSTQLTVVILTSDLTSAGTFAITVFNPTPGGGLSNAQTFTVVSAISSFDAVEVGAAQATNIFMKLAGTAFSVDILALNSANNVSTSYTGTVTVKLVDASGGVCGSMTVLQDYGSFSAFSSGRKTVTLTYANAARNAKIRINDASAGVTSCSTDNFSIRPTGFTGVTSTMTNAATSGTPSAVAGSGNFTLTAATGLTGYNGTPKIDNNAVQAHAGAIQNGIVTGAFSAAVSGTATGNGFTYSEVGNFRFLGTTPSVGDTTARGVYDDTYTSVDQSSDCTNDFSNILSGSKYGCKFGVTTNSSYFGRFYPDHFTISSPTLTEACSNVFTYFGQDGFTTAFTLTAQNAANNTTQNYSGTFAKLDLTNYSMYGFSAATLPAGSNLASSSTLPSGTWINGVANVTAKHQISRPTALTGETLITVSAAPTDGEVPAAAATALSGATKLRYGRLKMQNAYGSELLNLPIPLEAQYWNGSNYIRNQQDNCTTLPASSIAMGNYTSALAACETQIGYSSGIGALVNGVSNYLRLTKPGATNNGSVKLTLNLNSASGSTCISPTASAATNANLPWFGANPTSQATFGIYKTPIIYMRENY